MRFFAHRFFHQLAIKSQLFKAQTVLTLLELFQGPKKSQLSWLNPSNGPRNVFAPHQNHNGPRHIINRFINSYNAIRPEGFAFLTFNFPYKYFFLQKEYS